MHSFSDQEIPMQPSGPSLPWSSCSGHHGLEIIVFPSVGARRTADSNLRRRIVPAMDQSPVRRSSQPNMRTPSFQSFSGPVLGVQ